MVYEVASAGGVASLWLGRALKNLLATLDTEMLALLVSTAWLLGVQILAVVAWDAERLTRQGALTHWLLVGVLPPALALWSLPPRPER
jgi:hypothetical protein